MFELQASTLSSILRSDGDLSRLDDLPDIPIVNDPKLNSQLNTARQQSQQFISRLEQIAARLSSRRSTMQLREQIAEDIRPLAKLAVWLVINIFYS